MLTYAGSHVQRLSMVVVAVVGAVAIRFALKANGTPEGPFFDGMNLLLGDCVAHWECRRSVKNPRSQIVRVDAVLVLVVIAEKLVRSPSGWRTSKVS